MPFPPSELNVALATTSRICVELRAPAVNVAVALTRMASLHWSQIGLTSQVMPKVGASDPTIFISWT